MDRRPRLLAAGLLYHVIVRANQRQKTFLTARDYEAYLERLVQYRAKNTESSWNWSRRGSSPRAFLLLSSCFLLLWDPSPRSGPVRLSR